MKLSRSLISKYPRITQSHKNALAGGDDYIKDVLIETDNRLQDVIYNLLVSEAWKAKVYPLLMEDLGKLPSFKSYLAIHHEATIANLLEVLLFYGEVYDAAEDAMIELIDYAYRKMLALREGRLQYIKIDGTKLKESSATEETEA